MIGQQTECWRRADCGEGVLEMIATQLPDRFDVQRLGSLSNPRLELAGDAHQHLAGLAEEGVQTREGDRGLAGMLRPAFDRGHQPRPAGGGLASCCGAGQTDKQTPPVVDQRHGARRMQVVRSEAAPAPLIFQRVEGVLRIGPVAVELTEREHFVIEIGHQHGVFVPGDALAVLAVGLDEAQQLFAVVVLLGDEHFALQGAAQHEDSPLRLPAGQRQSTVHAFPALTRAGPARDPEQAFDVAFDVLRQAQFEQVRLRTRFELAHDSVRPEAAIPAHHLRPAIGGQLIEQIQQSGQTVAARMFVAGLDLDAHHQAKRCHHVGVVAVRRTARFVWVVRHDGAFLLAIQRIDRGVDVQNPWHIEQRRRTLAQVGVEPGNPFGLGDRQQRPAKRILTDDLVHPQQTGIDSITPNRRDVRVAPVPREHRQHPRAQHVGLARCVRAGVGQRARGWCLDEEDH